MKLRLAQIVESALQPALDLLPSQMGTTEARVMLLAICGQEADFHHRWQVIDAAQPDRKGPARGLLQFERGNAQLGGGVWGVFKHHQSHEMLRMVCRERNVAFEPASIWMTLERDDVLAFAVGRLLLWTDRRRLPAVGDVGEAWGCYERNWRPGKPHPEKWPGYYRIAMDEVFPPNKESP